MVKSLHVIGTRFQEPEIVTDSATAAFRRLLVGPDVIMAPGAPNPFYARLVARKGFPAVYMTGAGTTAVRLGMPDIGLLTMTEMVDNAARIVDASGLPVIADCDNGYGGPLNVRRAIQSYERAGVVAVHMEDQIIPKRCGHFSGKQLVSAEEMVTKIKAAVDAKTDSDFVVIARTDAIAVEGFDAAMDRAAMYEEAGADMLFVEAPTDTRQMAKIGSSFGVPHVANLASSRKTPLLPAEELGELGFKLVIYPGLLLLSTIRAALSCLDHLKEKRTWADMEADLPTFDEMLTLMGMEEVESLEERYALPEQGGTR